MTTPLRLFVALALASVAGAQSLTPAPATRTPDKKDLAPETVQLNAFEVRADVDNSYGALDSNSLTAFRMDLAKAPATAQVFTQAFMDDIGATSIEEVLTGYAGTVTAASNNAAAGLFAPGDRDGSQGLSYGRKGLPWLGEKYSWSTQLNVRNVLNHYRVWVVPTSALGTTLNARFSAQPRMFVWTNMLNF